MRAMALYDWVEDFDMPKNPEFLLELARDLEMQPSIVGFGLKDDISRRRTVTRQSKLLSVLSTYTEYEDIQLCQPRGSNLQDVESDLSYATYFGKKQYFVALPPERLHLSKLVNHIRLFCRHMTPRYGFSHVMEGSGSTYFLGGIGTTSMSYDDRTRAGDLGHSLSQNFAREHLQGKLHDIYELNVLSPAHMQRDTFGQSLVSWISSGDRGELVEIIGAVSVWLVPESIRPRLRKSFFDAGLLIATV